MKKISALFLIVIMALSLVACGQTETPTTTSETSAKEETTTDIRETTNEVTSSVAVNYPEHNITWYLAGGVGSGPDTLFRALINQLEQKDSMNVSLVPQNDMWANAIWACLDAKADGYAITNIPTPNIFKRDLDPANETDPSINDLALICNVASYYGCIALRTDDERFKDVNTLDELVEWCNANSNEMLFFGVKSAKGDDDMSLYKLQRATGLTNDQVQRVHCSTASENLASMLGGSLDVLMINEVDVRSAVADGQLKLIAMLRDERSPYYPEVPTAKECGYDVVGSVDMGVAMSPDVPVEIQTKVADYIETAVSNEEFKAQLESLGFSLNFVRGEAYRDMLVEKRAAIEAISDLLGWK